MENWQSEYLQFSIFVLATSGRPRGLRDHRPGRTTDAPLRARQRPVAVFPRALRRHPRRPGDRRARALQRGGAGARAPPAVWLVQKGSTESKKGRAGRARVRRGAARSGRAPPSWGWRFRRAAATELRHAVSRRALVEAAARYVPEHRRARASRVRAPSRPLTRQAVGVAAAGHQCGGADRDRAVDVPAEVDPEERQPRVG
jgi:hypothetical protein